MTQAAATPTRATAPGQAGTSTPAPGAPPAGTPQAAAPGALTTEHVYGLRAKGELLRSQRQTAVNLKSNVADQLRNASAAEVPGLEARIKLIDERIINVEKEITANNIALSSVPVELIYATEQPQQGPNRGPDPGDIAAIAAVFTIAVLMPISIAVARRIWRSVVNPNKPQPPAPEVVARLDRMENGLEAIAIEIERISEGQRFVTNLIGENAQRALNPGERAAEPVRLRVPEGARRGE